VADGNVVYADWMTGYGNILIIDHGNGYMSLYAHNDGLLKDAGDAVKRGDSGGQRRHLGRSGQSGAVLRAAPQRSAGEPGRLADAAMNACTASQRDSRA
jgi:murein DD-endopeptidase MepM/ murein hydrolase activator NlpD